MKTFAEIMEARGKVAVFTFGRFNPPTTGHEKLISKVASVAKSNRADYFVYPSHSQNDLKDPLPQSLKIAYMRKMFPKHSRNIMAAKERTAIDIAVSLHNKGYTSIIMVVGSDRVPEFKKLLDKYNGVQARHGMYDFEDIQVVSAGERDPDAEGVTGMSASKMRAAASANDFDSFKLGLPKGFKDAEKLFNDVRKYMGVRESFVAHEEVLTEEDVFRDLYIRGEILNIGEEVTDSYSGVSGKVIRRGTNYITFAEEDGTTHKKWLYELQEMTTGRLIKHVMAKSVKKKGYEKAVEVLKTVIDRKSKETDGNLKHSIGYYAAAVGKTINGIDARELAKAFKEKYPKLVEDCWAGFKQVGMKTKNGKEVPNCVPEGKEDPDIKDREGSQPKKYYAKDAEGDAMSKSTKQARARHFEKGAKKDDDDDSAYKPAPGDKSAKTKPSQYTQKMKKKFPDLYNEDADKSLAKKSEKSGISVGILKQVYKRGVAAWRTGHRPGTTPEQWGHARVNSFITGGKTRTTADADLWKQHKGKSEEVEDKREIGTDARRKETQSMTPGQKVKSFTDFKEDYGHYPGQVDSKKDKTQGNWVTGDPDKPIEIDVNDVEGSLRKANKSVNTERGTDNPFFEHVNCGTPDCCNQCETSNLIESNEYRVGSEKYFEFFQEKRDAYQIGVYNPVGWDKELMEGDLGKFDMYQGQHVPLDCPMVVEEKDVELNKPKVGGPKKYYVYVKDPSTGNVKKVTFGDTSGLKVKLDDKEARKNFASRHNCDQQKDKTKAGYWSCNLPRYAKQLGLSGGGNFFW